jgi:hypothetical protein
VRDRCKAHGARGRGRTGVRGDGRGGLRFEARHAGRDLRSAAFEAGDGREEAGVQCSGFRGRGALRALEAISDVEQVK